MVNFAKFECHKKFHPAMTHNKFAKLNDNQDEKQHEEDDEKAVKIENGRPESEKGNAKKSVAMLTERRPRTSMWAHAVRMWKKTFRHGGGFGS